MSRTKIVLQYESHVGRSVPGGAARSEVTHKFAQLNKLGGSDVGQYLNMCDAQPF